VLLAAVLLLANPPLPLLLLLLHMVRHRVRPIVWRRGWTIMRSSVYGDNGSKPLKPLRRQRRSV
jgi:hypothetical protein